MVVRYIRKTSNFKRNEDWGGLLGELGAVAVPIKEGCPKRATYKFDLTASTIFA